MVKVLVTGFEPFGGEQINPSGEAAKALHRRKIGGCDVVGVTLPVAWEEAVPKCLEAIDEAKPEIILMLGQAAGRAGITVERVAINVQNGKDNLGVERDEHPVVEGGPAAYMATVPIVEMVRAMKEGGVPASISNTAGTYLCNCLMYGVLHAAAIQGLNLRGTFIHLPALPEQAVGKPMLASMSQELIERGIELAIESLGSGISCQDQTGSAMPGPDARTR
ncbi:MAG: pyroglutamyl-peptidase I [Bacillota bacterium]